MSGLPTIAGYLAGYDSQLLGRPLQSAERMLIEEVLLDFMLDEPMLGHSEPVRLIREGLMSLSQLVLPQHHALSARLARQIDEGFGQLTARLARQEDVKLAMREHLSSATTPGSG